MPWLGRSVEVDWDDPYHGSALDPDALIRLVTRGDEWSFSVAGFEMFVGKRGKVLDHGAGLDDQSSFSLQKAVFYEFGGSGSLS